MDIKTQKILCLIPIVNFFPFIYFSFTSLRYVLKIKDFLKFMFLIFSGIFGTAIVRILSSQLFNSAAIDTIVMVLSFYILMGLMSWFSIRMQEKMESQEQEK